MKAAIEIGKLAEISALLADININAIPAPARVSIIQNYAAIQEAKRRAMAGLARTAEIDLIPVDYRVFESVSNISLKQYAALLESGFIQL